MLPMLNMRLVNPGVLISLERVKELNFIRDAGSHVSIGAMTTHTQAAKNPLIERFCPLISAAIPYIGHVAIRNRGSIGGSLAHADPAAELPAVVAALDATLILRGSSGERELTGSDFFGGAFTTALDEDELLVEIRVPKTVGVVGVAVLELARRRGDFALCGVAVQARLNQDVIEDLKIGLIGVGSGPITPDVRELVGGQPSTELFDEVGRIAASVSQPFDDVHATSDYRRRLTRVLARRAMSTAMGAAFDRGVQIV